MRIAPLTITTICILAFTAGARAGRLDVPGDYPTIQAAINAAANGDEIVCSDGTYTGPGNRDIDFLGKAITVRSESGPENCIIDCENSGGGFDFVSGEDANSILDGFTITKGGYGPAGVGIYCFGSSPTVTNCIVNLNSGPGISCYESAAVILDCTITRNQLGRIAGGIYCWYSNTTIANCIISANYGSAVYLGRSSAEITNCIISGNTSPAYGGAGAGIYCSESNANIFNCTISGNTTRESGNGGGIYCRGGSMTVTKCIITANQAHDGGGIYADSSGTTGSISNCIIAGNIACHGGGVANFDGPITNCIIADNRAENRGYDKGEGGGLYICDGPIANCTIVANRADEVGGGMTECAGPISNCIVWANSPEQINACGGVTYSDVQDGWPGQGNIDADPCFALSKDYHPMPGSACIDAGDPNYVAGPNETDLEGKARISGDVVDMGAYEHVPLASSIAVSPGIVTFYSSIDKPKPAPQTLLIRNCGAEKLHWEVVEDCNWLEVFPSRGMSTDQANELTLVVDPSLAAEGYNSCVLTVLDPHAANSPVSIPVTLHVGTALCVPEQFSTIQAAIDVAMDSDTVIVAPGTYAGDGNYNIDFLGKAITVRSTEPNDPNIVAETVIDCNEGFGDIRRGFNFVNHENRDSVLTGLTIINARDYPTGPFPSPDSPRGTICCIGSSPIITHCIIRNCYSAGRVYGGGPVGAITCRDGSNSKIISCTISENAGAGICCENSSPTIKDCTIRQNTSAGIYFESGSPTINNCTISENSGGICCESSSLRITNCVISGHPYGGVFCVQSSAMIDNCIISNNSMSEYAGGGGIECSGSNMTIINSTIADNIAGWGGGIYAGGGSTTMIANCIISNNSSQGEFAYGGGIIYGGGSHTISNCAISSNNATWGGGIDCIESNPIITNCTITGNIAEDIGGGVVSTRDASPILANCIVWGNTASQGKQIAVGHPDPPWESSLTIGYSDIEGGQDEVYISPNSVLNWGEGNIDADPCFVEPGYWDVNGVWVEGDYRLLAGSPCIDTGDPNYVAGPNETDLDGNPRILDGDEDGVALVDMGAYEFWPPVEAEMTLTPHSLSCASKGRWVKARVVLPEGYLPEDVDIDTPAVALPMDVESEYIKVFASGKGPVSVEIRFDRAAFCDALTENGEIEVTITGSLTTGREFYATDTIKIKPNRRPIIRKSLKIGLNKPRSGKLR